MAGKGTRLQAAAVSEARLQDAITNRFARELDPVIRLLTKQIRELYAQFELEGGRLVSTQANLGRAMRLRQDLIAALDDAGYNDLVESFVDAPLDELAQKVLRTSTIANEAAAMTPFDVNALVAFKELRLAQLFSIGDDAALTLWRATVDGVLGARSLSDLLVDVEDGLDVTKVEARTVYDTSVSTYSRQVEQLRASGSPDELFLYAGPADLKTRPFCRKLVGKVFTREEIEAMDNGQLPDVMQTGGGYNCRHTWKLVSVLDEELQSLAESGDRLGHVTDQLEEVA